MPSSLLGLTRCLQPPGYPGKHLESLQSRTVRETPGSHPKPFLLACPTGPTCSTSVAIESPCRAMGPALRAWAAHGGLVAHGWTHGPANSGNSNTSKNLARARTHDVLYVLISVLGANSPYFSMTCEFYCDIWGDLRGGYWDVWGDLLGRFG